MKAFRLVIRQTSANYRKPECVDNKMTYPLPPFSTVIGALHKACGYTEYHPMNVSIQGQYESMHREPYTDYCFLNSLQDDRGILVKMKNGEMLSTAFDKVGVLQRENELKKYEKEIKQRYDEYVRENYTKPISYFRTLTKSMKFYEVLNNIQLIIHIQADDAVLHDLEQHWTDIKSIGRSEDMVDIQQAKVIDLVETGNISATSEYSAYIDSDALKLDEETDERKVYPYKIRNRMKANGTRYYLNKNYELKDGKRIFEKKSVVYISQYGIDKIGNGIYLDQEDGKNYIVNFL